MVNPRQYFESFFRNPDGGARIRLGRGVVGNTTYGFCAAAASVGVVGWSLRDTPAAALTAIALLCVVFLIYLIGTWRFADKHPDRAMLGDSEWLRWWEQERTGLRGLPNAPNTPTVTDPSNPDLIAPSGPTNDA